MSQPTLEQLAAHVNLSPYHFHRIFVRYCGVTPKQFSQVLTVKNAKKILDQQKSTMEAALASGLSGHSRLHDHFINIEAVSPGEYKSKGQDMNFFWGVASSIFGDAFIAWTDRGIHRIEFLTKDVLDILSELKKIWPKAVFIKKQIDAEATINNIFTGVDRPLKLWVDGTNFQVMVWKALLSINPGELRTYQFIARSVKRASASRAVGNAIGKNPIAYLIPCHRVIQNSGALGGYRWNATRKRVMLTKEALAGSDIRQ